MSHVVSGVCHVPSVPLCCPPLSPNLPLSGGKPQCPTSTPVSPVSLTLLFPAHQCPLSFHPLRESPNVHIPPGVPKPPLCYPPFPPPTFHPPGKSLTSCVLPGVSPPFHKPLSLPRSAAEDGSLPPPATQGPVLSDRRRCLALDEAEPELCNGYPDTAVRCRARRGETAIPTGRETPGVPAMCPPPPPAGAAAVGASGFRLPQPVGAAERAGKFGGERRRRIPGATGAGGQPPHHLLEPRLVLPTLGAAQQPPPPATGLPARHPGPAGKMGGYGEGFRGPPARRPTCLSRRRSPPTPPAYASGCSGTSWPPSPTAAPPFTSSGGFTVSRGAVGKGATAAAMQR